MYGKVQKMLIFARNNREWQEFQVKTQVTRVWDVIFRNLLAFFGYFELEVIIFINLMNLHFSISKHTLLKLYKIKNLASDPSNIPLNIPNKSQNRERYSNIMQTRAITLETSMANRAILNNKSRAFGLSLALTNPLLVYLWHFALTKCFRYKLYIEKVLVYLLPFDLYG